MRDGVSLRAATDEDLDYVVDLLEANALPSADLADSPAQFWVAERGGEPVGCGGLERYGTDALLRSVVVEADARGRGFGHALCDALEARAREAGVERLYLLTTTASGFFAQHGYRECDRADAPDRVRKTAEFEDLCPAAATCMRKQL